MAGIENIASGVQICADRVALDLEPLWGEQRADPCLTRFQQSAQHSATSTGVTRKKTFYLGRVFADTTNSYKLLWFLAVLALVERTSQRSLR